MKTKIQKSLIQTNIKDSILAVMAIYNYVLMTSLVSLLKYT